MLVTKRKSAPVSQVNSDPYLTAAKVEQLKNDLERLIKVARPKMAEEVAEHAKLGDFSENAAYQMAKGKLRGINNRILIIQETLKNAIVIDSQETKGTVSLGSKVTLAVNGQTKCYTILGAQETDPGQGKISHLSPLGRSLIGHRLNDEISLDINEQVCRYKILKIE